MRSPRPPTPLLLAASAFALGTASHTVFGFVPNLVLTASFLVLICFLLFGWIRRPGLRTALVLSLFVLLGNNNAFFLAKVGHRTLEIRTHAAGRKGTMVTIAGRADTDGVTGHGRSRFVLQVDCIQIPRQCVAVSGRLQVHVIMAGGDSEVTEGEGVVVRGLLRPLPMLRNPADFDFGSWLRSNGIAGTLERAVLLQDCPSTSLGRRVITGARRFVRMTIERVVPSASQDLPMALILGDRSRLSTSTRNDFARSGLMHILAISGLHVMLVGLTVHRLLRPLLMRIGLPWMSVEYVRSAVTLSILILYSLISGASSSVVRAVTMTGFLLCGGLTRGSSNGLNAIGGAALVILTFDPFALHQAGFQLSFAAVGGLLSMGRGLDAVLLSRIRIKVFRYVTTAVLSSLVATLSTAPILMAHFGYVGLVGIVLNVVGIPVGAGVLISSLVTVVAAAIHSGAARMPGFALDLTARMLKRMAATGASVDLLVVSTTEVAAFGLACLLLLWALVTSKRGGARRWIVLFALATPALNRVVALSERTMEPRVDVLFLDVGHGDAAIVRLPDGKSLLVDAGNRTRWRDEGERVVLPNLKTLGIDTIDVAVVSHPHADHLGGIPFLLKKGTVRCLADNGQEAPSSLFRETNEILASEGICHQTLKEGESLELSDTVRLLVVAPRETEMLSDYNDQSIVLKLIYGNTSFLFTGDVEEQAERNMVNRYCDLLRSDVVKVPHHGSRTSSSDAFVKCTAGSDNLKFAVVSVGDHDKYGLPDEEIISRWKTVADSTHSTNENGALWLTSDGSTITNRLWKSGY